MRPQCCSTILARAGGQPKPRALDCYMAVNMFHRLKDLFVKRRIDPEALVHDGDISDVVMPDGRDVNLRWALSRVNIFENGKGCCFR